MNLALDVGNSQIYGGVFDGDELKFQFRKTSGISNTSDEYGLFFRSVLKENGFSHSQIRFVSICSVVPGLMHSLRNACLKYFDAEPFILKAGAKTGLKIKYRNPVEVGADRIANAIGAQLVLPGQNLILVDFGTATTIDVMTKRREYLGGLILPGIRLSMESLEAKTARLPAVDIVRPERVVGRTTVESIQAGLYFGNLGVLETIRERITRECFPGEEVSMIGTGGFTRLFEGERIFDRLVPELVLRGLNQALKINL